MQGVGADPVLDCAEDPQRVARILGERVADLPREHPSRYGSPPEVAARGLLAEGVRAHRRAVRKAKREPLGRRVVLGPDPHERTVIGATEQSIVLADQEEAPVLAHSRLLELDLFGVLEPEALDRRDVEARYGHGCHPSQRNGTVTACSGSFSA